MKYLLVVLLFFIGCEDNKTKNKVYIEDVVKTDDINIKKIDKKSDERVINNSIFIDDLEFKIKNDELIYSFKNKTILFFGNDNKFSQLQLKDLKDFNQKFYIIKNQKLINYFQITEFPTIIITKDNNFIKKYDGFIPKEMLKYEIKD